MLSKFARPIAPSELLNGDPRSQSELNELWVTRLAELDEADRSARVLVACVSEAKERSADEVLMLVRSLRALGGPHAGADVRVDFVEKLPPAAVVSQLEALGVQMRVCGRFDPRCPHANKLAMFSDIEGYDYLLALDTDIVVAGPFAGEMFGESIAVRPEGSDHFGAANWRLLAEHLGLSLPAERTIAVIARAEMLMPYMNSGVVLVPAALVEPLRESWGRWVLRLLDEREALPVLGEYAFFTDQIALAVALVADRLPRRELAAYAHRATPYPTHPRYGADVIESALLHHHHRFGPAGINLGVGGLVDEAIERVNLVLQEAADAEMGASAGAGVPAEEHLGA